MISILYVDDDTGLCALLGQYLTPPGGYRVVAAHSVPEALALLDQRPFDLVVAGLRPGGESGLELLRTCRQRFESLPLILFAPLTEPETVIEAFEAGADHVVQQGGAGGAGLEELAHRCEQTVGRRRATTGAPEILEHSPVGMHVYGVGDDGDLVFLGGNSAADRILGIEHEPLVGRSVEEVFPGVRRTDVPDRFREVAWSRRAWHADFLSCRDGRIEAAYEVWAYAPGRDRVVVQFIGIDDRVALEEGLREEARQWEEVFSRMGQPALVLSPNRTILAANRAAEAAAGSEAGELVGRRCADVFHGPSGVPEDCPLDRIAGSGDAGDTVEGVVGVGSRTYAVSCTPVADGAGRVERIIHVAAEITDHVRNEEALRRANDKLGLISSVTRHDLRNRLMGLQGYMRMADREADPHRRARYRRLIAETAGSMEEILAFAADYECLGTRAPEWQSLDGVVAAALQEVNLDGIRLEVEAGDLEVRADPLLRKVFSNLMENTVRYGGAVGRTRVAAHTEGDALVVVYEDDGDGIPRDEKELIFAKGYGKNTGLGLYLAVQILSITGIEIRETGTLGIGARFELRCPPGTWR